MLGEVADLHVVAGAQLARRQRRGDRRASRSASSCRCRSGPPARRARRVRATARRARQQDRPPGGPRPTSMRPSSSSKITRPERSGAENANSRPLPSRGIALDALDLGELLHARLRLVGLRRLVAEALDEPLHALDLRLLGVDRPAQRDLARGLLAAPLVPGAGEEARAAGLRAPARPCRPPPGTSGRAPPARPPRRAPRASARATPATRCRDGWWARPAAARPRRWPARAPATRASADRRRRCPGSRSRSGVAEAEAVRHRRRAVAPQIAAASLQSRLRARRSGRASPRRSRRPPSWPRARPAPPRSAAPPRSPTAGTRAAPSLALARRTLIVQRDPHALGDAQLAPVDRGLAREHPQQRRLARAVAPGDRHPFAALELERHPAQQRLPGHVLVQVRCDQQGHRLLMVGTCSASDRARAGGPSFR